LVGLIRPKNKAYKIKCKNIPKTIKVKSNRVKTIFKILSFFTNPINTGSFENSFIESSTSYNNETGSGKKRVS
jgi:hypothetical protein